MIDLPGSPARQASKVANDVIAELRALGLDAFKKGGYYDISPTVHDIVLRHARIALEACAKARKP